QINNLTNNLPSYRDELVSKVQRIAGARSGGGLSELEKLGEELGKAAAGGAATQPATQATTQPAAALPADLAPGDEQPQKDPNVFSRYVERIMRGPGEDEAGEPAPPPSPGTTP